MKGAIAGVLLMASSSATAGVLVIMWITGTVKVVEPVLWIRATELALALGMLTYGIWYLFSEIRRRHGAERR